MKYRRHYLVLIVLAVAVLLAFVSDANAQCSMCRATLSAANNGRFIRNFNIGVLVLLLPPVSIFCSIFIVLRRNRGEQETTDKLERLDP